MTTLMPSGNASLGLGWQQFSGLSADYFNGHIDIDSGAGLRRNEALGRPASVVTATVEESEESIAIELPPLDDGNQHRLLIAAVMSEAPIMELSYGGVVVDYYHQINGELFTLVASLSRHVLTSRDILGMRA